MNERFAIPEYVKKAVGMLNADGFETYIVGGCVRDLLLGTEPHDYDITTSALPNQTKSVFSGYRVIETGIKHGTVTVVFDGIPLEITTYRVDGSYHDGRHPDSVSFTPNLREDLARRDFTINAMAYHPKTGLVDEFGGREDLQNKIIRCVGGPQKRFTEDALRILRALRFASRLGFSIEPCTEHAAYINRNRLNAVSAERIWSEISQILCGDYAQDILLKNWEIIAQPIPELLPLLNFDQKNPHHVYMLHEHTARVVGGVPQKPAIRMAALLHDIGKPPCVSTDINGVQHYFGHAKASAEMAETIVKRLKIDRATAEDICFLVLHHDDQIENTEISVRRKLSKIGAARFYDLMYIKKADNLAQSPNYRERLAVCNEMLACADRILAEKPCLTRSDLTITGNDLYAAGIPKGREIGNILNYLLESVIDGTIDNSMEALLECALGLYENRANIACLGSSTAGVQQ